MPTSSERLRARATAYGLACDTLVARVYAADDALEAEECERVADRLYLEYDRLKKLAEKREQKEQQLEHRRKQG
jgi:hypothetical protein